MLLLKERLVTQRTQLRNRYREILLINCAYIYNSLTMITIQYTTWPQSLNKSIMQNRYKYYNGFKPTSCKPYSSLVDIPHCLHLSYNSGVKNTLQRHQHCNMTTTKTEKSHDADTGPGITQQLPKTQPMTSHACSLTRLSRQVLNSALPSGAIQSIQPPFLVLFSVFYRIRPHPFRTRDCRNPSSISCDKHNIVY